MMIHDPYDLIIIKDNVIPQKDIEEIMLLTNDKNTSQATIVNDKEEGGSETNLKTRNTLWYHIPDKSYHKLESAVSSCFKQLIVPKYKCEFKKYEPVQFLGYPVGGHYVGHNDCEHFDNKTRKWVQGMERDVSFLFYLNSEFGGGELEFYDLGLTIKPKKGMMIAFPSYKEFAHKVHPVTWGHRYTLVSWVATKEHLYDTIPIPGV